MPRFFITKFTRVLTFGKSGITLPPLGIFIHPGDDQRWLRAHELVHWDQYRRMGFWKFYWKYLTGFIRHGYKNHPMELEANGLQNTDQYKNLAEKSRIKYPKKV